MTAEQAHELRKIYKTMPLCVFSRQLASAQKEYSKYRSQADSDYADLLHDLSIYPSKQYDNNNQLLCDSSPTQKLLKIDMKVELYPKLTPKEL